MDPIRWGAALAQVSRLTEISMEELNRRFKITPAKRLSENGPGGDGSSCEAGEPKDYAPAIGLTARQRAEGFILGLLFAEPGRWHRIQQDLKPRDFTDESLGGSPKCSGSICRMRESRFSMSFWTCYRTWNLKDRR